MITPLGKAVRKKRGDKSLRDLGEELKEPFTMIGKVEQLGTIPSARPFVKLMAWLGICNGPTAKRMLRYTNTKREATNGKNDNA